MLYNGIRDGIRGGTRSAAGGPRQTRGGAGLPEADEGEKWNRYTYGRTDREKIRNAHHDAGGL